MSQMKTEKHKMFQIKYLVISSKYRYEIYFTI